MDCLNSMDCLSSMYEFPRGTVNLEEGWAIIQMAITKLINSLEARDAESQVMDAECRLKLQKTAYSMCSQSQDHSKEVYQRYEGVYNNYLESKVLPAIQDKHGVFLLQAIVKRWANYKVLERKLSLYFDYLDRNHVLQCELPPLREVAFGCFRKVVGQVRVKDAVLALINQERQGEEIDQTLLKNVIKIFVDLGYKYKYLAYYVDNFETAFLNDTADYYTREASNWTKGDCASKAEECLRKEKDRVSHYLHYTTEDKLLKRVQDVLNSAQATA